MIFFIIKAASSIFFAVNVSRISTTKNVFKFIVMQETHAVFVSLSILGYTIIITKILYEIISNRIAKKSFIFLGKILKIHLFNLLNARKLRSEFPHVRHGFDEAIRTILGIVIIYIFVRSKSIFHSLILAFL